ncbi:autotransporter domain-containing protein [Chelatococcus sp. GCM10030263]|uniref:autotransporter domain-containing protein n=1 Tax=Chelatococcus sp. GCM10030263 TaxID=3273387 RepID=UPI00361842CB
MNGGVSKVRPRTQGRLLAGVSGAALALSLSLPAAAQTSWTGTTSTDWTDPTNWSTGVVPTNLDFTSIEATSPNPTVLGVNGAATGSTAGLYVSRVGGAGTLTIQSGSVLTTTGTVQIGTYSQSGTVTVTGAGSHFDSTSTAGNLFVGNAGTGTLNIENGGLVTARGGVRVANSGAGTVNINSGGTLETTTLTRGFAGNWQVNVDNGTLRALGDNATWVASGFTGTQLNIAAGGLTLDSNGFAVTVASPFSGVGGVTKVGAGTVTFNTAQTYTGETVVQSGTLALTGAGSLATSGRVLVGGVFDISGITAAGTSVQHLAGSGTVELGAKNLTVTNANDFFAGTIQGTGGLTVSSGTQILSGANTYTGGTVLAAGSMLQIGAGGTSGSIVGDVANDGTLSFNRSDDLTFAGAVSGSGDLTKRGGGTLTLTGDSTYTGGTTISGGVLQIGDGGITGSITGDVVNNSTLAFNRSDNIAFAGTISGSGGVQKLGAGWLVLTGVNSYSGGTLISSGTLLLGDGGTTGSITGNVVNNDILGFNRSDAVTFGGTISGTGVLLQIGTGTTTLTGTNTYSGGTLISQGTLIGSATSFGSGGIGNFGALVIDQPTDATFGNAINETGSFTKRGAGSLNLTGGGTLSGATTVEAGRLSVNGSLANSAVTVLSGATLGGSGTVGATTIQSGATIAPGNSIGTLTVNGNLVLAPGSTYEVEIAGGGASDRIATTGSATVTGSQVGVTALDPQTSYINGQRYTIITAAGGVNGTVAGAVSRSAFLDLAVEHLPNQVDLVIAVKGSDPGPGPAPTPTPPPAVFQTVAQTGNQFSTALALNTLPQVGGTLALYNSLLMLDAGSARQAFNALSGEIYASAQGVMLDDSRYIREAVGDRLRQGLTPEAGPLAALAPAGPALAYAPAPVIKGPLGKDEAQVPAVLAPAYALWGEGFGAWGRRGSDGNASGLDTSVGGFVLGADAPVGEAFRVGVAGGYSRTSIDGNAGSSADLDTYYAALYGGGQWGPLGVRLGAAYSWHDLDATRAVVFPGFGETLKGSQDANTTQAFGEIGYRLALGGVALEPFAGLAYVNLETDAFTEAGGAAGLTGFSGSEAVTFTSLGVRAAQRFALGATTALTLRGTLGWQHAFGDTTPTASFLFSGGSLPFTVAGLPVAADALVVKAGADLDIGTDVTLGVAYSAQFAQDAQDQQLKGVLNVRF